MRLIAQLLSISIVFAIGALFAYMQVGYGWMVVASTIQSTIALFMHPSGLARQMFVISISGIKTSEFGFSKLFQMIAMNAVMFLFLNSIAYFAIGLFLE